MSLLTLDISKCVHTSNKFAICDKCVASCPVDTIKIEDSVVSFTPSECVGCGGCNAACPTSAYTLSDFNSLNYVFKFLESDERVLSCQDEELPCIASLSEEELLSLALISSESVTLDIGPCSDCDIAKTNLSIIQNRAEEVNFLLEAMGQDKALLVEELNYEFNAQNEELSRRELLSKEGAKKAINLKQKFDNEVNSSDENIKTHSVTASDIAKIKVKTVPDKRSLLMMAMKRAGVPEMFHTIDIEDISFISQKDLDAETCTNCQMCYRICPTGALSSDKRASMINFNPIACVQCHSCHDVCEPNSLTLKKTFDLSHLFEPKMENLVQFDIKRCNECGNFFSYKGGEVICTRCQIEEDEARELWGVK